MQSKRWSFFESLANAVLGYGVSIVLNWYAVPFFYPTVKPSLSGSVGLTFVFTVVSIARTYLFRRAFNHLEHRNGLAHHIAFRAKMSKALGRKV